MLPDGYRYENFFTACYRLLRIHMGIVNRDFTEAKDRLLSDFSLSDYEKELIQKVSTEIHHEDSMYASNAVHYLSVGVSAARCIRKAISSAGNENDIGSILDFPCGYGRVLRFLKEMFPYSEFTAVEIDGRALGFCERSFKVKTVRSEQKISNIRLSRKFDLIWCGSLVTNIDEDSALDLLKFFHDHLSNNGLCIFTTHGRRSVEILRNGKANYGLTEDARKNVIRQFEARGYGYADFPGQSGYGISVVSRARIIEMAKSVGTWKETLFIENGWDDNQDVFVYSLAPGKRSCS